MTSLLLSVLARMHRAKTVKEFTAVHPHSWLVWEPGVWKPPSKTGETLATVSVPTPPPAAGEALALALTPRAGHTGLAQLTLGRSGDCDIEINDATLSQIHLLFMEASPNLWTVRDAGSRNGSWVDRLPLPKGVPTKLASGARIQAAQVCLTFYDAAGLFERLRGMAPTPPRLQL